MLISNKLKYNIIVARVQNKHKDIVMTETARNKIRQCISR